MSKTNEKDIIIAGAAAAEGEGKLIGWKGRGAGTLKRAAIVESLKDADLSEALAPNVRSAVDYAGAAVRSLNNSQWRSARAKAAKWENSNTRRDYRARWLVWPTVSAAAKVGDSAGNVVLTVDLKDGSDDLHFEGDPVLANEVRAHYETARNAEQFPAGKVTEWLTNTLRNRWGAASYVLGYYVPNRHTDKAQRLSNELAKRWNASGLGMPLLPVATSEALKVGIAKGFADEIDKVAHDLQMEREKATENNKVDISPKVAGRLLSDLAEIDKRAAGYVVLCGEQALTQTVAKLRELKDDLGKLTTTGVARFALLELDRPAARWAGAFDKTPPSIKAAEKATQERHAEQKTESTRGKVEVISPVERKPQAAAPDLDALRAQFRAEVSRSGSSVRDFKRACLAHLTDPDNATPQDWLNAARKVNAPAINSTIADRASLLELD